MKSSTCDIEYNQNNSTLVVRPSRNGRLKSLVKTTARGVERVWVFKPVEPYVDRDGDERICFQDLGIVKGSLADGRDFLDGCRALGLVVQNNINFVPFSNGHGRYGKIGGADPGDAPVPISDYTEGELKMARWDALPSREQIIQFVALPSGK
jgi:hypothetical protein